MEAKNLEQWRIDRWFPRLDPSIGQKLKIYHDEVLKFNKAINLISQSTESTADQTHFADSILGWAQIEKKYSHLTDFYDLGSGNGFPGLVGAILYSDKKFIMVDSDNRKCEFLKHVISVLGLSGASVKCRRIEALEPEEIPNAVIRGLAPVTKTLLMLRKFTAKKGSIFHFKGSEWSREIATLPQQLCSTWNTEHVGDYILPETRTQRAVLVTTLNE